MTMTPLFLKPVFQDRIWGGTQLRDEFGYDIPSDKTGECWAISAHPNGESEVVNGPYQGKTLRELWNEQRDVFGGLDIPHFPLLTKILDANTDLSVQVHPDDTYALEHEGELGKTECWYIIDAKEGAEMIYGHHASSEEELKDMIKDGRWDDLLRRVPVQKGDFFYVPSGTIHALCEGTLVLETQQSSDTTYRVYDYDRKDDQGHARELHLRQAVEVTTVPHQDAETTPTTSEHQGTKVTTLVKDPQFFTVYRWEVTSETTFAMEAPFLLVSVLEGKGSITTNEGTWSFNKADHFVLPTGIKEYKINGMAECIVSHI
ncbi:mannose-6-phosphate isomerase, class I [Aureibacillus halotolerans]|uniref:Mannose-6-phosphate isomerase n=1 Tax=Aureibacillus halotolerans TaxID=1508390 RepID=A0A4R6TRB1_9BACI|nr:mannose-6-phosphate isomerase, class I [Aureibacillus halotolerans]TDQ36098.1 mannose-6-phosphate isomerase type 1 [Aureibacillus halotolerans]